MATSLVRFAKDFAKEAAYDQVAANVMDRDKGTSTGKPTWGGAAYDITKASYVPGVGTGKHRRYLHYHDLSQSLYRQQGANRRLQAQQWKQEQSLGRQRGTDAMNQMNHSVAYHYAANNEVYQECCDVAKPAPQQEDFMKTMEEIVNRSLK